MNKHLAIDPNAVFYHGTEAYFDRFEDSEALKAGLKDLDDGERKIIALRFLQGKSQSETGKILGVSQMFVSRAERKILQKLKERIEND